MKKQLPDIISALLVLLFVYAASSKLMNYTEFKMQIVRWPLTGFYARTIAWLIPAIELIIAVMLTVVHTRKVALYASLILLVIFSMYIAGMFLSGIHLPCSCGGIIHELSWKQHLVFNLFFIVLAVIGIVLERKQKLKYAV